MKKMKRLFAFCLPLFLLTGCWDRRDPEDREYVISMGADKQDGGYVFTFAPAKTREKEPRSFQSEGNTLAKAISLADCKNSRKTDLGQMKMVIFGKSLMEDERLFSALLSELESSREISEKIMVLATDADAAVCMERMMEEDSGTGLFLWDFYKNTAKEVAVTQGLDLESFLMELKERQGAAVLPCIRVQEGTLRLGGGIALAEGSYARRLDDREEMSYLLLEGEAEGAVLEGKQEGNLLPLKIVRSHISYDFEKTETGGYLCTVRPKLTGDLMGSTPQQENGGETENLFEEIIKKELENTIQIAVEEKQDFFGTAVKLRRAFFVAEKEDVWKKMEFRVVPIIKIRNSRDVR